MSFALKPQEKSVELLLRKFPFEEDQIENFVECFFLRRVTFTKSSIVVDFLYLESITPDLEFTQKVEYFFQLNFEDKLTCEFSKVSKRTLLTYKFHRRQQDFWDTSLMPLKPPQLFNQDTIPIEFLPEDIIFSSPPEPAREIHEDIEVEMSSLTLEHTNKEIITPPRKVDVQKNIVETDKVFVEKISGSERHCA